MCDASALGNYAALKAKSPMKSCELCDCALSSSMSSAQSSVSEAALYMLFLRQSRHSFSPLTTPFASLESIQRTNPYKLCINALSPSPRSSPPPAMSPLPAQLSELVRRSTLLSLRSAPSTILPLKQLVAQNQPKRQLLEVSAMSLFQEVSPV